MHCIPPAYTNTTPYTFAWKSSAQELTKQELKLALTRWGMTSKYGRSFGVFVDSEFERLDQNGDGTVSAAEFRACYGRFHLLYRSSLAAAQQAESNSNDNNNSNNENPATTDSAAAADHQFSPGVPTWMREEAIEATDEVWAAFQQGQVRAIVEPPPTWFSYVVSNSDSAANNTSNGGVATGTRAGLRELYGFDVEEVMGFADAVPGSAPVSPTQATEQTVDDEGRTVLAESAPRPLSPEPLKSAKCVL